MEVLHEIASSGSQGAIGCPRFFGPELGWVFRLLSYSVRPEHLELVSGSARGRIHVVQLQGTAAQFLVSESGVQHVLVHCNQRADPSRRIALAGTVLKSAGVFPKLAPHRLCAAACCAGRFDRACLANLI
ncbi:TOBE domain-containing protein [Paenibacillus sp. NPDC058071]|uniref:TOBE domain-containing protein n=1 Tax=Paenibacillus sp. NPDC058071 TaxID=3346326 RepID=UPI0036DB2112